MSENKKKEVRIAWTAIDLITPDKPEIESIVDALDVSKNEVVGALLRLLCWSDEHCTEDGLTNLSLKALDRKIELPGFAQALIDCGWAREEGGKIIMVNYANKNGKTAKKRLQDARRQARSRGSNSDENAPELREMRDDVTHMSQPCHDEVTQVSRNERDENGTLALPRIRDRVIDRLKDKLKNNTPTNKTFVSGGADDRAELDNVGGSDYMMIFGEWLKLLCDVHPAGRGLRVLPPRADVAARDAFSTGFEPNQNELNLLSKYYAAAFKADDEKRKLWRPDRLDKFFETLPSVIECAKRWAEFWGVKWKPKSTKPAQAVKVTQGEMISTEEAVLILREGLT